MASIENSLQKNVAEILGMAGSPGLSVERTRRGHMHIRLDSDIQKQLAKDAAETPSLEKAWGKVLNSQGEVHRLAFESDPTISNKYHSLYKAKSRLIPDKLLKRILIQDDLVASIVQARQNQMSAFGRPRPDRFSTGFVIEARQETKEAIEKLTDQKKKDEEKEELRLRIAKTTKRLMTCGDDNLDMSGNQDKLTFPQYISMSIRNAIGVGRLATEVVRRPGTDEFAGIRVIDAGTIYRAEPQKSALEAVRRQARVYLEQLKNDRLDPDRFQNDDYAWVQVFDERPLQAFTAEECLVHNFYPVPDIDLDGYPVTPLDTAMSAVTTHINITTHNKLYFQSGRAARGMLVIQSDDIDERTVAAVRQQFNAQINSVNNAWRMPVFGIGAEDKITWQPIDSGGRDMEFQYLADQNARVILSAFLMAPDELPGWSYLSRGTANQALSEGNNEYKLEAARDVGIRPLLAQFEDFLNQYVLPLFDKELAEKCVIKLVGLDAETAEKESVRIQQDMPIHMTYDEVLEKVEKKAIGKAMGGEFPLNPQFQAVLDKYLTVGQIKSFFFGDQQAAQDPQWAYVRDPFWFQWQQLQDQRQQMAQQQQMAAQQQQAGAVAPGGGGGDDGGGGGGGSPQGDGGGGGAPDREQNQTEKQKTDAQSSASASPSASGGASASPSPDGGADLTRSVDQALGALSKSEAQLPASKRKNLNHQRILVLDLLKGFQDDAAEAQREIADIAEKLAPKTKA